MKVSLNWLKEYVDIQMSHDELGHVLTMAGLEVEGIEPVGQGLDDILVAKIVAVEPHPDADTLSLCQVNMGRETAQVVCGAPNLEPGSLAPIAPPGSVLPDGTSIEESRIRGQLSRGMLLAEDEMGLTDDHSGIMILPSDFVPGESLSSAYPLSDWVFDLSITPNRPDWTSVIGVAREIAALTGKELTPPDIKIQEGGPPIEELTSVTLDDPLGCPRYAAGMIMGVELGPSPFWMRYRLHTSGIRSINNIVDVTNYVLMEMGQPLHSFDYDRLKENRIVVRRAEKGDSFTTLDGETRKLNQDILMIRDGGRPVALAGIMGGLNSEIFAGTANVLVESAFFDPVTIRRGSKWLGLSTEASYRFERGIDIGGVTHALKRSLSLMNDLAGGTIITGIIDNYPKKFTQPVIHLEAEKTNRLLGTALSCKKIGRYLEALGVEVSDISDDGLNARPPSHRVDLLRDVDLMEEVARLDGYDNIPVTYPSIRPSDDKEKNDLLIRDRARQVMTGLGFSEVITYSFISPDSADRLGASKKDQLQSFVKILNPLSTEQSVMRTSLIPGLLNSIKTNIFHDEKDLKFFEWGRVFIHEKNEKLPSERVFLAGVMTGRYHERVWNRQERMADFYDTKGAVQALLNAMGLKECDFIKESAVPGYDKDVCCSINLEGLKIGHLGKVASEVAASFEIEKEDVYLFEIEVRALLEKFTGVVKFVPFAKFPAVYRDISIIVDRQLESSKILDGVRKLGGELVESIDIFDVYEGKKIDPREKAIAFSISYRSKEGTLDGEKINRLHESIIDRLKTKTGGRLKEG
ncbi:phenylalanine--tRNA ligase subunit beta [Thermodesulfobacteriota bacterium]